MDGWFTEFRKEYPKMFVAAIMVALALIAIVALFVAAEFGFLQVEKEFQDVKREITQRTQRYTEAKAHLLSKLHGDYMRTVTAIVQFKNMPDEEMLVQSLMDQNAATLNRMHDEAGLIPESEIPAHIASFLETHSRTY